MWPIDEFLIRYMSNCYFNTNLCLKGVGEGSLVPSGDNSLLVE